MYLAMINVIPDTLGGLIIHYALSSFVFMSFTLGNFAREVLDSFGRHHHYLEPLVTVIVTNRTAGYRPALHP